jgi:serine/threonine-protein kinase
VTIAQRHTDRLGEADNLQELAKIQVAADDRTAAIKLLQRIMTTPFRWSLVSTALLKLDPAWDPLRNDPRFRALLKKYSQLAPASTASSGAGHE